MRQAARAIVVSAVLAGASVTAAVPSQAPSVELDGPVAALSLPPAPSPGTLVVGGARVEIPRTLTVELPAAEVSLEEFFARAPARCVALGESGVAATDRCRTASAGPAKPARDGAGTGQTLLSVATAHVVIDQLDHGRIVARRLVITRNGEPFWGGVTFVSPTDGYLRVNGALREDEGGTIVRLNDPTMQQSVQQGAGCDDSGNCSPDPRFQASLAPWSARFVQGNPACIGTDSQGCPASNRSAAPGDLSMRVPIQVGDNVVLLGSFETVRAVRFFSAQSLLVQTLLDERQ